MSNKLASNLLVAFLSQGISLAMSLMLSFILPKMLGVNQYGYSQLFIFYIGYVGFFHFGINDGLYLRLGGREYSKINHSAIGTEFKIFILFEITVALVFGGVLSIFAVDPNRRFIILLTAIYLVINNLTLYLGFAFQAVNETKWFSYSVMIDRIVVIISIIILLVVRQKSYIPFVIAYTVSRIISFLYCIWKGKEIVFARGGDIKDSIRDILKDASIGIKLTISNIVAMLIIGSGRMIIDNVWGIESFGKISLAFSLTNFFLVFIQQVSMVLFPALRRIKENQQIDIFVLIRRGLNMLAPVILILYIPMQHILGLWLPAYRESLVYLAYLLPICIFDGKMQMIFTTYFKVLREEKRLMTINIISLFISLSACLLCGYIFESMIAIVASMVTAIIFRSVISDFVLCKQFGIKVGKEIIYEIVMIALYVFIISYLSGVRALGANLVLYICYLLVNHKELKALIDSIKMRKNLKQV